MAGIEETSAFSFAIKSYLSRSPKKKKPLFAQRYLVHGIRTKPEEVQQSLAQLEQHHSGRRWKGIRAVFDALYQYDGVLSTLCQADPMPSALIWGGLKGILECIQRHHSLNDKIHQHLASLSDEVKRLSQYESLFRESNEMKTLLVSSYVTIIRFWEKVDEELSKNSLRRAGRTLSASAIKSLDGIIDDMVYEGKSIAAWVPIVTERIRRNDHHDVRNQSEKMAGEVKELLRRSDEERKATHERNVNERRNAVQKWIRGDNELNPGSRTRQRRLKRTMTPGTGDWILSHPIIEAWTEGQSTSNVLWINGGPGVGKSVVCAHMITSIQDEEPSATVVYYYHRMDDLEPSLDVYRNLAEQFVEQLFNSGGNLSDKAFDFIHGSCNEDTIRGFVSTLVESLEKTYIFIDGIDETFDDEKGQEDACELLLTLSELAEEASPALRIWCSSIARPRMQECLRGATVLVLDASINSHDIETFFARGVSDVPVFAELDSAEREDCIRDIKSQVRGNFLWASMMVETIRKSNFLTNLDDLQQMVRNGLPGNFEDYLQKKTRSLQHEPSSTPSIVLSCLAYAKRPLSVQELSEAITMYNMDEYENISHKQRVFKTHIINSCAPLVETESVDTNEVTVEIFTFCHSSVRRFLRENPDLLSRPSNKISPSILTTVCLKYLQQPKYCQPLQLKGSVLCVSAEGQSIKTQHLLQYAAEYWNRHVEESRNMKAFSERVERLLKSPNFATCLQVQSVFLGGQNSDEGSEFPACFLSEKTVGKDLWAQYTIAMREWGYLLSTLSSKGLLGAIEQCLWGSLGKENFLHKIPSRYRSHAIGNSKWTTPKPRSLSVSYAEDGEGAVLHTLWVQTRENGERSIFHGDHRVVGQHKRLREFATRSIKIGRDSVGSEMASMIDKIKLAAGGSLFAMESTIYCRDHKSSYQQVQLDESISDLSEDLSYRSSIFAVSSRQLRLKQHVENSIHTQENRTPEHSTANDEQSYFTDSDSRSGSSSDVESIEENDESNSRPKPPGTLFLDSETVYSNEDDSSGEGVSAYLGSDNNSGVLACCTNSARETCSETSTAPRRDEIAMMGEELQFYTSDQGTKSDGSELNIQEEFDSDEDGSYKSTPSGRILNSGIATQMTAREVQSLQSSSSSESSETSGILNHGPAILDQLVEQDHPANPMGETSEIRVFRMQRESNRAVRIFRYSEPSRGKLLDSPPAFHPTQDAMVWPLGGSQVIFANLAEKTYQLLRFSTEVESSDIVSMQARFSPCGEFLHLACFYGATDVVKKTTWPLSLQASTYRLSARKTTRCAPRLINYTACVLDSFRHGKPPMALRTLPFTVTWTDTHVYVTASRRELDVRQLSLFQSTEAHRTKGSVHRAVFRNTQTVYLPASADARKVYFHPRNDATSRPRAGPGHRRDIQEPTVATVVLSGPDINLIPSAVEEKAKFIADRPPIALYLTATQLGMEAEDRVEVSKPSKLQARGYNIDVKRR